MALDKPVRQWLRFALDDLKVARSLEVMPASHLRACAYHAQQAVEKAIKGYLAHHKVRFSKTHIIKDLLKQAGTINPALAKKMTQAKRLTQYAIEYRYPDAITKRMTRARARSAARLAERMYELIAADLRGRQAQ